MGQGLFSLLDHSVHWRATDTKSPQPVHRNVYHVKIALIGDSGVGKSSLILGFSNKPFDMEPTPTVGIDFTLRNLEMDGNTVKLKILDTPGKERYRSIAAAHSRNAHGIILVYDVTNEQTFRDVQAWLSNSSVASQSKVLIGNKADLKTQRQVSTADGQQLADELGISFYETSAKDRSAVDDAFLALVRKITDRLSEVLK